MFDLKNAKNRNGKMCQAVTVDAVSTDLRPGDLGTAPTAVSCDACGTSIEKADSHRLDERYLCPGCFETVSRPA